MRINMGAPSLIAAGAAARALMAGMPNVEPITLAAMVAGMRYGPAKGFITGFMAMLISDFYIGLPGPWTLFTTFGFGVVGFMAGFLPKAYSDNRAKLATYAAAFTAVCLVGWDGRRWAPLWIPMAAIVAVSRPYVRIHHASDIAGGVVAGAAMGVVTRRIFRRIGLG